MFRSSILLLLPACGDKGTGFGVLLTPIPSTLVIPDTNETGDDTSVSGETDCAMEKMMVVLWTVWTIVMAKCLSTLTVRWFMS